MLTKVLELEKCIDCRHSFFTVIYWHLLLQRTLIRDPLNEIQTHQLDHFDNVNCTNKEPLLKHLVCSDANPVEDVFYSIPDTRV